jgi:flagellar biosynthesis protein FlhF
MTVRRFVGATARDCLRRAKETLGADAVVVSNRAVEGGVEIVAMSPESLNAISQQLRPMDAAPAPRMAPPAVDPAYDSDYTVSLSAARREAARQPGPPLVRPWEPQRLDTPVASKPAAAAEPAVVRPVHPAPAAAGRSGCEQNCQCRSGTCDGQARSCGARRANPTRQGRTDGAASGI